MAPALKIDFVSPLPPVRSGIADYSADLLPHLAELGDLRLIRLPEQEVSPELAERFASAGPERLGEGGRLPFYQMGNNHYHAAVYELALAHPGVLTLHDVVLHHFLAERTLKVDDFDGYRRALGEEHGWIGDAAALPRRWPGGWGDAAVFALPAHRRLLSRQRGVLVHSTWAASWLAEEMPGLGVTAVPMGIPPGEGPRSEAGLRFRRRHGLPEDAPLLGSFGFQTPIKRTDAVIRTLARPEVAAFHLLVGGEVESALEEEARRVGVLDRVHFLGFLPFHEFEAAIAATDLCLNLRYPTAGETSASLLRILAVGKPAIVSDYAQSADLRGDVVVKVPLGDGEEETLARRLAELLEDRERLATMGENARQEVLEAHDPGRSAAAMVRALDRFATASPLGAAPPETRVTSFLTSAAAVVGETFATRMAGELTVAGAEEPWDEGERRRLRVRLANRGETLWLAGERPDGGIAVEVRLESADGRVWLDRWQRLPFHLAPGKSHLFELDLRRPPGRSTLRLEPHILGHQGFAGLGGPVWEKELR